MYIVYDRLRVCVSVYLSLATFQPGCKLGNNRGCPLAVHYWADLQSVTGFVAMTT